MKYLVLLLLLFHISTESVEANRVELKVAVLTVDSAQISAYAAWANKFEALNPDTTLKIDYYSDRAYKAGINSWLEDGAYDVMYWQAGTRLSNLVDTDLLRPISSLIDTSTLSDLIPADVIESVTYENEIYALPYAQYAWGFYYNKEIFKSNNLLPPKTWQEFEVIIKTLKSNNIFPLIQANTEGWPMLAWLDYFSFMFGEKELRNKLLLNSPLSQTERNQIVGAFSDLIANDNFIARDYPWVWQQTISMVGRKEAAMTLMGQFAESNISHKMSDKIGFFNFPSKQNTEVAITPLEVFILPKGSRNVESSKKLIKFLLDPKNQSELALSLGWLPVNLNQINSADVSVRQQSAIDHLKKLPTRLQYFDRESEKNTSTNFVNSLSKVFEDNSTESLESALAGDSIAPSERLNQYSSGTVFKLSSIKGHTGTFLATSILRHVYQSIGLDLAITRFQNTQASLESYKKGIDGELVRIQEFESMTKDLVRVPEPLFYEDLYLLTRGNQCDAPTAINQKQAKVGVSSDALALKQTAERLEIPLLRHKDKDTLWEAYNNGEISHLLTVKADIPQGEEFSRSFCKQSVARLPLYHFVHKKHAGLVNSVLNKLDEFKSTDEYKNMLERFAVAEK